MPPNAKDETQEMFRYLDKDNDESLSFDEMKAVLVEAGFKNPRSIFKGFDLNEDGVVTLEGMNTAIPSLRLTRVISHLEELSPLSNCCITLAHFGFLQYP